MKKSKLLAVSSAFLALFCVLGASSLKMDKPEIAMAENTPPSLTIEAKNVSYADSIYILYAVSNDGFDRNVNEIQMLFWETPQTEYKVGTESYKASNSGNATVKGVDCQIFY